MHGSQQKIEHVHAGAKDMSQVPVQWGVHEDVFCAVSTVLKIPWTPPDMQKQVSA